MKVRENVVNCIYLTRLLANCNEERKKKGEIIRAWRRKNTRSRYEINCRVSREEGKDVCTFSFPRTRVSRRLVNAEGLFRES